MIELSLQQCNELSRDTAALEHDKTIALLEQLNPSWQLDTDKQTISFEYKFNNYYQTMAFVNVVAQIAHQQNHHPDLNINYSHCTVTYSTHSVNGLSLNDFICAAKINAAQAL